MAYSHTPSYVGKGAFQSGTTGLTVPVPTGIRNDDMLILIVETANQAITAPTGWTEFTNSPQSTGTAAAAGGVRLGAYWKIASGAEASVSVADSGDHQTAIMFAVRGVDPSSPIDTTAGRVDATATTAMSWQTLTTTNANEMILMLTANDQDLAGTAQVGTITAASLTGITEIHDQTVIAGAGGGVHAAYGFKATAGSIGTMTATGAASVTHAYLTVALKGRSDAISVPRGQYALDQTTPIAIGGAVVPYTDGIYLANDISPVWELDQGFTANVEAVATSSNFANTASATDAVPKAQSSDTTYSSRGGCTIYDAKNDRYIMFGGYDGTTRYNTVWAKDMTVPGQPWRKLAPTGTPPSAKNLAASAYVRGNKTTGGADTALMVIWGGNTGTDTNEMHYLDVTTPGSEVWGTITQTSAPTARSYISHHMVATPVSGDTSQNYVYLFGGWATARENQLVRCTIDVDSPGTCTWTTLKATGTAGNPNARSGCLMDYKASTGKLYIYGGYDGTTYLNDFWEYDIAGNTFTQITVSGTAPTGTELLDGGYDAVNNRFWFTAGWQGAASNMRNHIGYISSVGSSPSYVEVRAHDADNQAYASHASAGSTIDTKRNWLVMHSMQTFDSTERYNYIIDLNDGITSNKPVYGMNDGDFMGARDAPASVWNPDRSEFLVINGFAQMGNETTIAQGTHVSEVWAYDQANNRWRYAVKGHKTMPHTEGSMAVYDSVRQRVIVFGGLSGISETMNEAWALTPDVHGMYEWTRLNPTGTPPTARWLCAGAFDATNNRMVVAMGGNDVAASVTTTLYELSFASSADGAWIARTPTGTATAVIGPGFAYKSSNNRLYIFGGATNAGLSTVSSQLVYLDLSSTTPAWTTPTSSSGTGRRTPAFGYDPVADKLITFAGYNGSASIQTLQYWDVAAGGAWTTTQPTTQLIDARRSTGHMFIAGKLYVTHGRSDSSMWYAGTWELTPNYGTPASSTWANKFPRKFLTTYTYFDPNTFNNYHWQAWSTEETVAHTKVAAIPQSATYYFDASDAAVADPNSLWSNDANVADGSTTTFATYGSTSAGSNSTNYIGIEGTNAPGSGDNISSVRVRMFLNSDTPVSVTVSTDTQAEQLGTLQASTNNTGGGWSSYLTLNTPSGGWTWTKVQALEARVFKFNGLAGNGVSVARVEILVDTINTDTTTAATDFILSKPFYTRSFTTDALKRARSTTSHTTDTIVRGTSFYTRESNASLPTVATPRSTGFLATEYATVSSDNATYIDLTGNPYLLFQFEKYHTNNTDQISATWNGKSTLAPSSSTVYLQIWNKTSSSWETIASDSATAANTDFTLTGGKTTSLTDYYDTGNRVVFRVYQ